jgi:hypothetical protein
MQFILIILSFLLFDRVFCCKVTSYLEVLRLQNPTKCLASLHSNASTSLVCVCVAANLRQYLKTSSDSGPVFLR